MKKYWTDFLKVMDHKFRYTPSLSQTGFEMDGDDGLRNHCYNILKVNLHGMKACDYLYQTTSNYVCIEFSDLARMRENYSLSRQDIDNIKISIKPFKKGQGLKQSYELIESLSFDYSLKKEIAKKALDTDSLLANIREHSDMFFKDPVPELPDKLKPFYVIWNDPNNDDIELSRILDLVSDDVNKEINSLNLQEIEKKVYITTLSHLFSP